MQAAHPGQEHIVQLLDNFTHTSAKTGHQLACVALERLGSSLQQVLRAAQHMAWLHGTQPTHAQGAATAPLEPHHASTQAASQARTGNSQHGVPLPLPTVKSMTRQVLHGLAYMHEQAGLVHRDLKPGNIMTCKRVVHLGQHKGAMLQKSSGPGASGPASERGSSGQQPPSACPALTLDVEGLLSAQWKLIDFGEWRCARLLLFCWSGRQLRLLSSLALTPITYLLIHGCIRRQRSALKAE